MFDPAVASRRLTRRASPLVDPSIEPAAASAIERVRRGRILVTGGAGSIGGAVVKLLVSLGVPALHVVDTDENALADLVRDIRAGTATAPADFRTSVVAMGTDGFRRFVADAGSYDVVLNLAALKHVRSERDMYGLARMIDTNVRAVVDLFLLRDAGRIRSVFSVSSDKAVKPHNLMGATKRWMEKILAAGGGTTTRFANVAFSKGSLPRAILQRLDRHEPVAAPSNIRRYFITDEEAAWLCVLAAFDCSAGGALIPKLEASDHTTSMVEVAEMILEMHGLRPRLCGSADEAKHLAATRPQDAEWWPCFFSPADTTGEKDVEEFRYADELELPSPYANIASIRMAKPNELQLNEAMKRFERAAQQKTWSKDEFVAAIRCAVEELAYSDLGVSLDDRM